MTRSVDDLAADVRARGLCPANDRCDPPNPQSQDCADCLEAEAALSELVALVGTLTQERDEARRDWQMYVHEVTDATERAEAAEALVGTLTQERDALRSDPDGVSRWRGEAEMYMREFGRQRERAEAAEAALAVQTDVSRQHEAAAAKLEAALAKLQQKSERQATNIGALYRQRLAAEAALADMRRALERAKMRAVDAYAPWEGHPDPSSYGGHPYTPTERAMGYGTPDDPRFRAAGPAPEETPGAFGGPVWNPAVFPDEGGNE